MKFNNKMKKKESN